MPFPHKFIKLTPEQKKQVEQALKHFAITGQYKKHRRLQFVYLSNERLTFQQISKRLGVSYRMVQKWYLKYRQKELGAFLPAKR